VRRCKRSPCGYGPGTGSRPVGQVKTNDLPMAVRPAFSHGHRCEHEADSLPPLAITYYSPEESFFLRLACPAFSEPANACGQLLWSAQRQSDSVPRPEPGHECSQGPIARHREPPTEYRADLCNRSVMSQKNRFAILHATQTAESYCSDFRCRGLGGQSPNQHAKEQPPCHRVHDKHNDISQAIVTSYEYSGARALAAARNTPVRVM
jgi:hypothetical protein